MNQRGDLGPIELDRAAGVLVAAAAGDALGAGYEFGATCEPNSVVMRPGVLTGRRAGSWTDDTDMAVCIARVVADGGDLDTEDGLEAVGAGFLEWYASHPPDIGNQTRAVLSSASEPEGLAAAASTYQETRPEAAGNGSLMRTGPVALAHLGDDEALARAARGVSSLTHAHERAGDACVLWCVAIDRAIRLGRLDGVRDGIDLLPAGRRAEWTQTLDDAERLPLSDLWRNGFVVTALQAAWRAVVCTAQVHGPARLEAALRAAVGIGGDTDTVAAIAGALLGARYGAAAVPFEWRYRLRGWPPGTEHADLVAMGVLGARQGRDDERGWPRIDDLTPHDVGQWAASARTFEIPGRGGVVWGGIAGLTTVDTGAFISLSRVGRRQRRGPTHHQVWLVDGSDNAYPEHVLADTADAVETLRRQHGSVFVHGVRCESRTPSVAAAWLMRHHGLGLDAALDEVGRAFPAARINPALLGALRSLDRPVQPAPSSRTH